MNDEAADIAAAMMADEVPVEDDKGLDDLEEDIDVSVGEEEEVSGESEEQEAGMFPDVDKDKDEDESWINIEGCNPDGRARAILAFKDIKKKILDAYSTIGGKNAELFKTYLIKNLDAYRKQAEKEIPNPDDELANLDHTELKC
jgi:hypothetical protein